MVETIMKRDGRTVEFKQEKIAEAENFADTGLKLPDEKAPANPDVSAPQAAAGRTNFEEIPDSDYEILFSGNKTERTNAGIYMLSVKKRRDRYLLSLRFFASVKRKDNELCTH